MKTNEATTINHAEQHEALTNKIGYSAKIGKQVLKQQLSAELKKCNARLTEIRDNCVKTHKEYNTELYQYLMSKLQLAVRNDGAIARLRNVFKEMFDKDTLPAELMSNWAFVQQEHIHGDARSSLHGMLNGDMLKRHVEKEEARVHYNLHIGFFNERYDADRDGVLIYTQDISLTNELIELAKQALASLTEWEEERDTYSLLRSKLRDIDNTVEQMEAELLVNELNSSEEGRKVLEITSNIVKQMLGDTPPMLEKVEKPAE
jgi:hypothetical protein